MKIKNDLISIRIGRKQYDFRNLILDEYLKAFANSQLDVESVRKVTNGKSLYYPLLKFDTPIQNLNEKSVLVNEDFDIFSLYYTANQEVSENQITTQYNYTFDEVIDFSSLNYPNQISISNYIGRKITAIGFSSFGGKSSSVYSTVRAVLDTSNYNIYLQPNQEFTVTRKDIISTDALFYSNNVNKVPGPLHLMPVFNKAVIKPNWLYDESGLYIGGTDESYGIIHSIGLSSYINRIDKEFVIGEDIEITQNGAELEIEGIENYLSNEKLLYPNSNLYPSSSLYPVKSNYKYIIIKYKVWQNILSGTYENPVRTMTDTGYFYYQAVPINKFGKLDLKIKYERG